jgi:hypothetical protein
MAGIWIVEYLIFCIQGKTLLAIRVDQEVRHYCRKSSGVVLQKGLRNRSDVSGAVSIIYQ